MTKEPLQSKKTFFTSAITIAAPIALQNLMQSLVGFTDIAMVSQLGQVSTASIGLGSQVFFAVCVAIFGIASGGAIFMSRCWGKKDFVGLQRFTAFTVFATLTIAIPLMFVCYFKATEILLFFSNSSVIAHEGRRYLELTAVSFPFTAITISLCIQLRCVEKSHYPMYMSVASFFVNILLNYILIFGHLGAPAMGVTGAAIATLTARVTESIVTVILFFSKGNPAKANFGVYFKHLNEPDRRELIAAFLKLALPIMMMEIGWAVGQGGYKLVYARMGLNEIAAYTVIESILNLFSVIFIGLGNAAAIMIGKEIGLGKEAKAVLYAKSFIKLNFLLVIPMSIILAFVADKLISLYNFNAEVSTLLSQGLFFVVVFLSFKSYNFLMMGGILRAGGDSRFMVVIGFIGILGIGCPLSFLMAFYYKMPFIVVFLVSFFEENLRNVACFLRYRSRRWLKLDVLSSS